MTARRDEGHQAQLLQQQQQQVDASLLPPHVNLTGRR